jgi:hypothetical protein
MLHEFKIHQTKGNMDDGSNFDREHFMTYSSSPNKACSKILHFPLAKFVQNVVISLKSCTIDGLGKLSAKCFRNFQKLYNGWVHKV